MTVDHIAFLTRRLETVTETLPEFCTPGPVESYPGEGTREQYVEVAGMNAPRLLFIQPAGEGPYQNAMLKRGPGLHHIGCITGSIKVMVPHFTKHRLLLHPVSISTIQHRMVWLCRPEVPFLIELMESDEVDTSYSQTGLLLPHRYTIPGFINGLFFNMSIGNADDGRYHLTNGCRTVALSMGEPAE
jgi:hypothetical protein